MGDHSTDLTAATSVVEVQFLSRELSLSVETLAAQVD